MLRDVKTFSKLLRQMVFTFNFKDFGGTLYPKKKENK